MTVELAQEALANALTIRGLNNILILHLDRGKQYTAEVYRNYGKNNEGIRLSYSSKGCSYDNTPRKFLMR